MWDPVESLRVDLKKAYLLLGLYKPGCGTALFNPIEMTIPLLCSSSMSPFGNWLKAREAFPRQMPSAQRVL